MAAARYLDKLYLFIVGTQLLGMLVLDLVQFYPKALWEPPSAPLHFLVSLRTAYVAHSGDPFFGAAGHEPWFEAFLLIELLAQLPLCAYLVSRLARGGATDTRAELAGVAIACLTGMGAAVSCFHVAHLGGDVLDPAKRTALLYGTYLPFFVIPVFMGFDMCSRVLARVDSLEKRAKSQ